MANTSYKKVLLLIRDKAEDDLLMEIWKSMSLLRDSYLKHVYSRRNQNKKLKREVKTAVTQPKNSSVGPQQIFSEKPLSCIPVKQLNSSDSGGAIDNKVVHTPVISPPVVESTPLNPSTSQLVSKLPSPVASSVPNLQQELVTSTQKVPSPPLKVIPPPEKSPSPPTVGREKPDQLNGSFTLQISPSPPIESREKVKRSWSSLVAIPATKSSLQCGASDKVTRVMTPSPPLIQPPKPTRHEKKLREDPVRLKWIERRKKLIEVGADLSAVGVGREDLESWPDPSFKDKNRGTKNLYVVWCGRKVGVFCGWDLTKSLMNGYGAAGYQKVASDSEVFQILEEKLLHKGGG